jgi:predicted dehydrogenase
MERMRLAVIGAGVIGRTHIDRALKHPRVQLVAIADPTDAARSLAESLGVPWFADYKEMLAVARPQGAIVATPNATHASVSVDCMERGVAVIVEKPIADTLEEARRICDTSRRTGVPALVGHHRRYNPVLRKAKEIVAAGRLGKPVAATVQCTWYKADAYYDVAWRRQKGGGPVLINLIHDIDALCFLFGELESLQATTSNATRGFEVEDTAAVILRFRNGALGTVMVSDTAVAPWNWDLAIGEVERFPRQHINSHYLSGTEGSLTLPQLEFWNYRGEKGWESPLTVERTALHPGCPYVEQLRHFAALVAGEESPVCSAEDGLRTLQATLAVTAAAASGQVVSFKM